MLYGAEPIKHGDSASPWPSVNTFRKEVAQRKEGKREGSKGSSHSEKMPGLGWGRMGPKRGPLRGAEKAGCFEAKVLL